MNYVEKVLDGVHSVLNLNAATLSGAIDIIVVPQEDGTLKSTPFHVRFGKLHLLNSTEKKITVYVNDEIANINMKLGNAGEAFFIEETEEFVSPSLVTSPIGSPPTRVDEMRTEVKETTTVTSKMEQMIAEDAMIQPTNVHVLNEEKPDEHKEKIVPEQPTDPRELPPTSPPITIQHKNTSQETIQFGSPEETHKGQKAEPQHYFSWRWGALPKYKTATPGNDPVSDSDSEVTPKNPEGGWRSLFKIFKGVEPQYIVRTGSQEDSEEEKEIPREPEIVGTPLREPFQLEADPQFLPLKSDSEDSDDEEEYDDADETSIDFPYEETPDEESRKIAEQVTSQIGSSFVNILQSSRDSSLPAIIDFEKQMTPPRSPLLEPISEKKDKAIPNLVLSPPQQIPESPITSPRDLDLAEIQMSKCAHLLGPNIDKDKIFQDNLITYEAFCANTDLLVDPNIVFKIRDKMYPWSVIGPIMVSHFVFKKPLDIKTIEKLQEKGQVKKGWGKWFWPVTNKSNVTNKVEPPTKSNTKDKVLSPRIEMVREIKIKKSLRPTSDQLKALKLKPGPNQIRFSVTSILQGTREVHGTIYLWNKDVKIVISDIDGTITKSDVFGHILPMLGRDWSHSGIAELYTNINKNNYKLLYLTSRPIGQAGVTRGFISTLKQGEKTLPQGPIFMSPNRLLSSLHQEVVLRRPDEFKIACLKDIQSLFPVDGVFYAGFGNRVTDALSYQSVGVPIGKIFIVNYRGEINILNSKYKKTYATINDLVDEMFTPINEEKKNKLRSSEQWNNWNYWKAPLPSLDDDVLVKSTTKKN